MLNVKESISLLVILAAGLSTATCCTTGKPDVSTEAAPSVAAPPETISSSAALAGPVPVAAVCEPEPVDESAGNEWKKLLEKGMYLSIEGQYAKATEISEQALAFAEKSFGSDHTNTIKTLKSLAESYAIESRYDEAEGAWKRLLATAERPGVEDYHLMVQSMSGLAGLYRDQGRYADAEPLYRRLGAMHYDGHGEDHPGLAVALADGVAYEEEIRKLDTGDLCSECHR